MTTVDEFLEHHGVKGQRWGVRSSSDKSGGKKLSRHERRAAAKQAKQEETAKKVADLMNAALKQPTSLIQLNGRQVITGKQFIDHMVNGGLLNINTSRVFARQETKNGPLVLQ